MTHFLTKTILKIYKAKSYFSKFLWFPMIFAQVASSHLNLRNFSHSLDPVLGFEPRD